MNLPPISGYTQVCLNYPSALMDSEWSKNAIELLRISFSSLENHFRSCAVRSTRRADARPDRVPLWIFAPSAGVLRASAVLCTSCLNYYVQGCVRGRTRAIGSGVGPWHSSDERWGTLSGKGETSSHSAPPFRGLNLILRSLSKYLQCI